MQLLSGLSALLTHSCLVSWRKSLCFLVPMRAVAEQAQRFDFHLLLATLLASELQIMQQELRCNAGGLASRHAA